MSDPWFERLGGDANAPMRLFIFPFAGGGSAPYRAWAPLFPSDIDLQFVMLPGRERRFREAAHVSAPALLGELEDAITPLLDRPYGFFGHSMGASLAYEMARRTRPGPCHLFVSGRRAPGRPRRTPRIYHLPDAAFHDALRQLGGTPPQILNDPEMMRFFAPVLRADFELSDTYSPLPGAPLACPLSVFGGTADPEAEKEDLEAWRDLTQSDVDLQIFEGNHFFLFPHRAGMAAQIGATLKRACRV
ncbi:thioesterase domain-containing protein [Roseovarius aestuarii]|nr:thioesterase domain-containing protein [Roseovarius aestuarii]